MPVAQGNVDGHTAMQNQYGIPVSNRSWALQIDTMHVDTAKIRGFIVDMECFNSRHFEFGINGWVRVPKKCLPQFPTVLDPYPTVDTSGIAIAQITGGPNNGLWYPTSLQTKFHQKMQLLRDFRVDAIGLPVRTGDSVVVSCKAAHVMDSTAAIDTLTIGIVDSVCKARVGLRHRVDSLWRHEHCHVLRAIFKVRDTVNLGRIDTVERLVRTSSDGVRGDAIAILVRLNNSAMSFSTAIDTAPTNDPNGFSWPAYWGMQQVVNGMAIDSIWRLRKDSVFAQITPSNICP
jgi:hypothetical protein